MQTVVIFDFCGEAEILYGVFDEDLSHLDRKIVNIDDLSEEDDCKISSLVCKLKEFPVEAVKAGAKVITCGFAP